MEPVFSGHPWDEKSGCYREVACIPRLNCTLYKIQCTSCVNPLGSLYLVVIERWPANTVTIIATVLKYMHDSKYL